MAAIKRALVSCYDKTDLEAFAGALASLGVELIASGGTGEALRRRGLRVRTIEEFTGSAEQLDGRVKTLHPKIHAGILALRDNPAHVQQVGPEGLIDLVIVNLYPFERTIAQPGVGLAQALEQIDIGGVALLRAAAKNFAHVGVVCQPAQYPRVLKALQEGGGALPETLRKELASAAFELTSAYDRHIAGFLGPASGEATAEMPRLRLRQTLRYGENPHQAGAWYVPEGEPAWGLGTLRQLQGKDLSYNNLLDTDAALRCVLEFQEPTCVIVKHLAPCGLACAEAIAEAYERALACDAESAFGGIIAINRPLDAALAARLAEIFLEVVVAPAVSEDAAARLKAKPNVRVLTLEWPSALRQAKEWRQLLGGWLLQDPDALPLNPQAWRVATVRQPSAREREDLLFAWKVVKHVKSNGIVLASGRATCGIGQGQPSRIGSVRVALEKAGAKTQGAVAASDAFFPFPDGVELLARAGVTAVIQPGGSMRDTEVIQAADRAGMAMLLTGVRHFRH